jgi:tetratricopeptide (TPR) repeat protein
MAERLLYLPSVGFCLLVGTEAASVLEHLKPKSWPRALAAGAVAVAGGLLVLKTWTRNAEWRDGYALWRAEVRQEPRGPIANNYVALEYMGHGQLDSAGAHLVIALNAAPGYWDATLNAGRLAHKEHNDSAAAVLMQRAHTLAPRETDPLFYLAVLRATEGQLLDAVDLLAQAEALAPTQAWTRICRGWYLERLARSAEANAELKRALELDPSVSLGNCVASVL